MKERLLALGSGVLLLGCQHAASMPAPRYDAIYRYINVALYDRIELGRPFVADRVVQPVDDSTLTLLPAAIVDPDHVRIFVTPSRYVYAFTFDYVAGETYAGQVAHYTKLLGPAVRAFAEPDGTQVTRWEDAQTRFDIWQAPGQHVMSRLTDRALGRL